MFYRLRVSNLRNLKSWKTYPYSIWPKNLFIVLFANIYFALPINISLESKFGTV